MKLFSFSYLRFLEDHFYLLSSTLNAKSPYRNLQSIFLFVSDNTKARNQADQSFESMITAEFIDWLRKRIQKMGVNHRDLDDIVQKTLLTVWSKREQYDPKKPLKNWVIAFAERIVRNEKKKKHHLLSLCHFELEEQFMPSSDMSEIVSFLTFLKSISPKVAETWIQVKLIGIRPQEIASNSGIPLNTVYSRIRLFKQKYLLVVNNRKEE
ncbi:MAG: RNA polymerase sigma factor [Sandaracinaceae bacterium]|nr:RNA polymerase sigma factor [Sandaracinaceae bacterium]